MAGGTHHAFRDRGEGYCVFSDIAVAARVVLNEYPASIRKILIVDLDVHQGNGNSAIFRGDDRVRVLARAEKIEYGVCTVHREHEGRGVNADVHVHYTA